MPSTYPDYSYSASPVASLFGVLLCLIPTILVVVGQAKIFLKAGEHWWGALIPFYSSYVMFRIAMGGMEVPLADCPFCEHLLCDQDQL